MIVLSNKEEQTIAPGESIIFDITVMHSGSAECHRLNSSGVKLKTGGKYEISFNANAGTTATIGTVSLAAQLGGETIERTRMNAISMSALDRINIGMSTYVNIFCCDSNRLTITNVGTIDIVIAPNSNLAIRRLA